MSENKKEKKGFLKRFKKVFSKQIETDRKKKEEKKRLKKAKPKGYGARKAGAITFWVLFLFMFLVVFVTFISGSNNEVSEGAKISKESKITSQESVEFTKSFLYDYFNIKGDSDESSIGINNSDRLSKYLASHVTDAEINLAKGKKIKLDRNEIIVKDVEKVDEQNARHTFLVNLSTERPLTEEEQEEVKKLKKDDQDPNEIFSNGEEGESTNEIISGDKVVQSLSMYVSVPIYLKDNNKEFVVSELPSFTYLDENNEDNKVESKYTGLKQENDNEITENIERFMFTFFESYSQDSIDKLSYILQDEEYQIGLNQTLNFTDISDTKVYKGKNSKEYIIDVDVDFIEPKTEMELTSNYMLVVAEEGSRYIVKYLNNDEYITELLMKQEAKEEDSDDEDLDENELDEEKPMNEEIEEDIFDPDSEEPEKDKIDVDDVEDKGDKEDKEKDEDSKKDKSKSDKV